MSIVKQKRRERKREKGNFLKQMFHRLIQQEIAIQLEYNHRRVKNEGKKETVY